jgi:uncharacterized protein
MLFKHSQFIADSQGRQTTLHDLRTKDGAELDFALADGPALTHLIECKLADAALHRPLQRFAAVFPEAQALQLVRDMRQDEDLGGIHIRRAGEWLYTLAA